MTKTRCINKLFCSSQNVKFLDKYKFNVDFDRNYLGNPDIYFCQDCNLSFADPMPNDKKLIEYYTSVYRGKNRPHSIEDEYPIDILNSRLELLENNDFFSNVKNILEIGPGNGEFGKIIKDKHNIDIFSIEPDENAKKILKDNGYKIFDKDLDSNFKFDLVLSFHSLEHFNSLEVFFDIFEKNLNKNAIVFVEVPNNEKDQWFKFRPYDSPHLIFFSKIGLKKVFNDRKFDVLYCDYFGEDIRNIFEGMKVWRKNFGNWSPSKKYYLKTMKNFIKNNLPNNILELKRKIFNKKKHIPRRLENGNKESWTLRIIAKKNN